MKDSLNLDHWARNWLIEKGVNTEMAPYLSMAIDLAILFAASFILDFLAKKVILRIVGAYVRRSKNEYDDILLKKKVFMGLAHLLPAILIYNFIPFILNDLNANFLDILQKVVIFYMIIIFLNVMTRFFRSLEEIGLHSKRFEGKPVSSYVQLFILVTYIVGGVIMLSLVVGKSPQTILAGFGAATAVILLIFRDTILGLVASIQISANDMVRLGDWVGLDKYGADGNVTEINLTTVKIKNWDKTITTVPTYAFISDSFKNWRGMENTGLRRIKRHIYLDLNSVQFVSDEMYQRFSKIRRVSEYLKTRQAEIDQFNEENKLDTSVLINGRHMTNIGVFRRYALKYLEENVNIDQNETVMVRQLQPTEKGIALEIYAFSNDIAWVNYENIQSDIFDHLMSAVGLFDLNLFQSPSGNDFRSLNVNDE